jgi:hypothetical protein
MIKFTKEKDFLKNRLKKLSKVKYTSEQEKEILLLDDDEDELEIYKILVKDKYLEPLNKMELLLFLIKLRENSVSDILEGMKECEKCGVINDFQIDLSVITDVSKVELKEEHIEKYPDFPIGLFESIEDILDEETIEEISVLEYNEIEEIIYYNNEKLLNLVYDFECRIPSCKHKNVVVIFPKSILSKTSLTNLYEEYFALSFYGSNTYSDINKMYPFERELFTALLTKKMESQGMPS